MTNAIHRSWLFAALLLIVVLTGSRSSGQKNNQAEVLLQEAQSKVMVEGRLEEAIQLYRKILAAYAANRSVAAQALVAMGQCYEKLGNAEARNAYQRVLREYADQAEPAGVARQRLAAFETGRPGTEVAARRVWDAGTNGILDVSSDSRYVLFRESDSGNLAARELATGKTHRITSTASPVAGRYVAGARISPDNRQVAYAWTTGAGSELELDVAGFDGSSPRVLLRGEALTAISDCNGAWMLDGKRILAVTRSATDQTYQRLMVNVADGLVQRVGAPDKRRIGWGCPSWDGRYIAYEIFEAAGQTTRPDVWLFDTRTGRDVPLVQHTANDWLIGWTPDSKKFIFSSDRSGAVNFWAVEMEDGKPKGPPQFINRDPEGDNLTVTRDGTLFQIQQPYTQDVYVAKLDPAGGRPTAQPAPLSSRVQAQWMQWSADGKSFYYRPQGGTSLIIRSLETDDEREVVLTPGLRSYDHPRWFPDGRSILVSGWDQEAFGLFRIELQTGVVSRIVRIPSGISASPSVSPDGKAVYYQRRDETQKGITVIVQRDLDSGTESEVHRGRVSGTTLSPDGRQLTFAQPSDDARFNLLVVMEVGGGKPREVARTQPPERMMDWEWSSDGRYVLFAKSLKDQVSEVWRAPVAGGQPERIAALDGMLSGLRVHPRGEFLGLEVVRYNYELWALENYLK